MEEGPNLCISERLLSFCTFRSWDDEQENCKHARKSEYRDKCVFFKEIGGFCDCPFAQMEARDKKC